jgi:hypothetical protein
VNRGAREPENWGTGELGNQWGKYNLEQFYERLNVNQQLSNTSFNKPKHIV